MRIFAIESTCDETSAAIVDDALWVRGNVVASQEALHAVYRGVVPEIASRAHIQNILPVVEAALRDADARPAEVDAIAVAHRPGLIGSLLVGVTAAKTLAWALGKPLLGVDHVQAHLYSVQLQRADVVPLPAIGLVCSGGHTALYHVRTWTDISLLGKTIDDAVGEAYDKVAAILDLGYPGGPIIDHLARQGDARTVEFPRSLLERDSLDFSFSGLKTSVLYYVRGRRGRERDATALSTQAVCDIAASFQAACVDTLVIKIRRALDQTAARSVIVGGGVSANAALRAALQDLHVPSFVPLLQYCTDNAAMIGGLAGVLLREGVVTSLHLDAATASKLM